MLPHRIRLRGPWRVSPQSVGGQSSGLMIERIVRMPARWEVMGLGDFHSLVRFFRSFGCPAHIDPDERAWLVFEGVAGDFAAWLNQELIGQWRCGEVHVEVDVTGRLRERNELEMEFAAGNHGTPWREVALEFRGRAWLTDLSARLKGDILEIAGNVMGRAECDLDLYAILGRSPVIHTKLATPGGGRPFRFESESLFGQDWPPSVRIELVCGSAVWHSEDVLLSR